jgi:hypothetical protein
LFVQATECVAIACRGAGQGVIFVEVKIRQEKFLPAELNQVTPPGFRSCREYNMQHFNCIEGLMDTGWYNEMLHRCPIYLNKWNTCARIEIL